MSFSRRSWFKTGIGIPAIHPRIRPSLGYDPWHTQWKKLLAVGRLKKAHLSQETGYGISFKKKGNSVRVPRSVALFYKHIDFDPFARNTPFSNGLLTINITSYMF
jgi:hypothetical protein